MAEPGRTAGKEQNVLCGDQISSSGIYTYKSRQLSANWRVGSQWHTITLLCVPEVQGVEELKHGELEQRFMELEEG